MSNQNPLKASMGFCFLEATFSCLYTGNRLKLCPGINNIKQLGE